MSFCGATKTITVLLPSFKKKMPEPSLKVGEEGNLQDSVQQKKGRSVLVEIFLGRTVSRTLLGPDFPFISVPNHFKTIFLFFFWIRGAHYNCFSILGHSTFLLGLLIFPRAKRPRSRALKKPQKIRALP